VDFDAEGTELGEPCPQCESVDTVTYLYVEGFTELECRACGFTSEVQEIADLARYRGDLRERDTTNLPPIPLKKLEA
jgi:Zn ribbon nucleic-acid-binding protein